MRLLALIFAFAMAACSSDTPNVTQPDDDDPNPPPAGLGTWGMLGDSQADEYRADDNRGGAYAATTLNWLELLVRYRDFDFGEWGTRSAPRRAGYAHNWARSGATSYTLIAQGQHTGLAAQIRAGEVDNVVMEIGANDFSRANIYDDIYDGALAGAALSAELDRIYENIVLALETVIDAGADHVFLGTVPDRGLGPVYIEDFPNATRRQAVSAAIGSLNARLRAFAQANDIVIIDYDAFGQTLLSMVNAQGELVLDGEGIDLFTVGDEPHHMILGDREHAGTVSAGLMANMYIDAFNTRGFGIRRFTNAEILANAGIR